MPECAGIDHADFSPDGRTAVFTCEFAGAVVVLDVSSHKVLRVLPMPRRHTRMGPQDIKLAPDGSVYYIADSDANGLWVLDVAATKVLRFISTGVGAHGLYLSRDAQQLYVSNRHEGSVSVLDARTGAAITKWRIPGGGSPDMGNTTADGSTTARPPAATRTTRRFSKSAVEICRRLSLRVVPGSRFLGQCSPTVV